MRKAQIASSDIVVALVIFVIAAAVLMSFLIGRNSGGLDSLDQDSDLLINDLVTSDVNNENDVAVAAGGTLNEGDLTELIEKMTETGDDVDFYQELKSELGIQGDYCIHFEDEDGNIIYLHELVGESAADPFINGTDPSLDEVDEISSYGIGSDRINISGKPCYVAPN